MASRRIAPGIDLSEPMLAVGRKRARVAGVANVEFVADDAARRQFATQSFDAVISRFGLMFFDDPVMAFTNLRHAPRAAHRRSTGDRRGQRSPRRDLRTGPWRRTRNRRVAGQRASCVVSLSQAWKPPTRSVARCSPTSRSNAAARLDW